MKVTFDEEGWRDVRRHVIATDGLKRMKRVAAAANSADGLSDGYMVSTEGDETLNDPDRATVITATAKAMAKNKKHGTLRKAFGAAAGA